jgi:hypothetical protein
VHRSIFETTSGSGFLPLNVDRFMGRSTVPRICPFTPMQLSLLCGSAHESSARVLGGARFGSVVGGPTPGNVKLLLPPRQSRGVSR